MRFVETSRVIESRAITRKVFLFIWRLLAAFSASGKGWIIIRLPDADKPCPSPKASNVPLLQQPRLASAGVLVKDRANTSVVPAIAGKLSF